MKKFLLSTFIVCFCTVASAQEVLIQTPETPLTYLGNELTSPTLKVGYTKRTQYFGTKAASLEIDHILVKKYADLPIYSFFSQTTDAFDTYETQTIISRTTDYMSYVL